MMVFADYEAGWRIRREVLGDQYVTGSGADWAGAEIMQELVVRTVWGTVWSRPGLGRKTRSMVSVAILATSNRQAELAMQIRGALRNGVTVDELVEVALHCAVYAGMPSAIDTVRLVKTIHDEVESSQSVTFAP